jgi:hypothetical protein
MKPSDRLFGIGCNHLHEFEKNRMAMRGLDPAGLVPIESIGAGDSLQRLCKGGLPRYWNDEGAVLVHPLEVIQWAIGLNAWVKNGTPELLAEAEGWAREFWPGLGKGI